MSMRVSDHLRDRPITYAPGRRSLPEVDRRHATHYGRPAQRRRHVGYPLIRDIRLRGMPCNKETGNKGQSVRYRAREVPVGC